MRVREPLRNRGVAWISRRIVAAVVLCGVATPSMALDLKPPPELWVSAAALSLTLVSAVTRPKD